MGPLGLHGFARNSLWTLDRLASEEDSTTAALSLAFDQPPAQWPHSFVLRCLFTLHAGALTQCLEVTNTGSEPFEFTTALHTYFKVSDIADAYVDDLSGCSYLDSLDGRSRKLEHAARIEFAQEVDRVYLSVPRALRVGDAEHAVLISTSEELQDAVVWNPWVDKAKRMPDYGDDEYRQHVCVEVASCGKPVVLAGGGSTWRGEQTLSLAI
jgi:glucose-6-phosphate 1-epimerase